MSAGRFKIVRLEERVAPTGGAFSSIDLFGGAVAADVTADAEGNPADDPHGDRVGNNNTLSARGDSAADVRAGTGD